MTPEEIGEVLRQHRSAIAKRDLLRVEIDEAEAKLKAMLQTMAEEAATSSGNGAAGMPRSTKVGNPTERIGLMLASGEVPQHIAELKQDIAELTHEMHGLTLRINRVAAWLVGLPERERWVVTGHLINGLTWSDLAEEYQRKYGQPRTRRSLQRLKRTALRRIAHTMQ